MRNKVIKTSKIFIITFCTFIIFDLIIGNYVYKKILRKNFFDIDTHMSEQHPIYNHGLKKNYNTSSAGWGKRRFEFCTDNFGFRNFCNVNYEKKNFDMGIIGDSHTVGLGLNFKEVFSTIISNELKKKKIANLGVSSYSTAIYYSKINYLLENDFDFKEIIVFLDLSDLYDDSTRYKLVGKKVIGINVNPFWDKNHNFSEKFMLFLKRRLKVTHHIIFEFNNLLIKLNMKEKTIPYWVENNPYSSWTYNYDKTWYENKDLDEVINNSLNNMTKLHNLLKQNNIELSIAVYPLPNTLKHDNLNNLQVKIWRKFCENKCKKFYNFMDPFFELKKKIGYKNLYFKYFIEGDVHLNEFGNRLIADSFLKEYKN